MSAEIHAILTTMISDLRRENCEAHSEIMHRMNRLNGDVGQLREWRARIIGISAALSAMISATAWAASKVLGS